LETYAQRMNMELAIAHAIAGVLNNKEKPTNDTTKRDAPVQHYQG